MGLIINLIAEMRRATYVRTAMHCEISIAVIDKAGRDPVERASRLVGVTQQHGASIRGHRSARKTGDDFAAVKAFKFDLISGD